MESQAVEGGWAAFLHLSMERAALGIEVLAVLVIVLGLTFGTVRFLVQLSRHRPDAYATYKSHLVRALLLGLEFLVAADIVRTVALESTLRNVAILGALVLVRTFLSWSLVVEGEGRWPWQPPSAVEGLARVAERKA